MGWLGRLFGKGAVLIGTKRPTVPAGGRAFVSQEDDLGSSWTIRVAMADEEPSAQRPRLAGTPRFKHQVAAYQYLDWVNGDAPTFTYPPGEA